MITKDTTQREFFVELQQLEEENCKLRKENRRLSAENGQLQQILNTSDYGIFIRDTNQRLVYVNETFCQHVRSNKTKLLQNTPGKLGKVAKRYFKDDKEVKRSGSATFNLIEYEDEAGKAHWINSVKYPFQDDQRGGIGVFGFTQDVTELTKTSKNLREISVELRKAEIVNEALRQFSYAASHDLQEPLRAVQGFLKLLVMEQDGNLGIKANQYIELAENSITNMQNLIKDILDYAVINGGKYDLEEVDLDKVIDVVKLNLGESIREHDVRLTAEHLPKVQGCDSLLIHFFQNLISNAIKYRKAGVNPVIAIVGQEKKNKLIVAITDNGIGIDEQFHQEIFKPFKRLHRKSEFGGSGIGLATSKRIVDIHGGKIWLNSEQGVGSTFFVELPTA